MIFHCYCTHYLSICIQKKLLRQNNQKKNPIFFDDSGELFKTEKNNKYMANKKPNIQILEAERKTLKMERNVNRVVFSSRLLLEGYKIQCWAIQQFMISIFGYIIPTILFLSVFSHYTNRTNESSTWQSYFNNYDDRSKNKSATNTFSVRKSIKFINSDISKFFCFVRKNWMRCFQKSF